MGRKILVVDDEELNCVLLKRCLRGIANEVIARNAEDALAAI